jgi:sulfur carrier protein ThiS
MSAVLILRNLEYNVRSGMTLRDALLRNDLQPEAYLAIRDGTMITDDEILREGDQVKLIAVISGG